MDSWQTQKNECITKATRNKKPLFWISYSLLKSAQDLRTILGYLWFREYMTALLDSVLLFCFLGIQPHVLKLRINVVSVACFRDQLCSAFCGEQRWHLLAELCWGHFRDTQVESALTYRLPSGFVLLVHGLCYHSFISCIATVHLRKQRWMSPCVLIWCYSCVQNACLESEFCYHRDCIRDVPYSAKLPCK